MYWVLWALFQFSNGTTLAYPVQIYDSERDCVSAASKSAITYKRVLEADLVRLRCVSTTHT